MFEEETLLASGCSFTDDKNCPKWDIDKKLASTPKWPHLLGFKKVYNIGKNGASNDMIFKSIEDKIINENFIPDRIIIGLTEFTRFYMPIANVKFNIGLYDFMKYINNLSKIEVNDLGTGYFFKNDFQKNVFKLLDPYIDRIKLVEYHLRNLYHLANLCLIKNIKLHVFQMLDPYTYIEKNDSDNITELFKKSNIIKEIRKNPRVDLMDWSSWGSNPIYLKDSKWVKKQSHAIGVSIKKHITNGEVDLVWGFGKNKDGVELWDGHPNEKGHKKIAEWILKNVKKD